MENIKKLGQTFYLTQFYILIVYITRQRGYDRSTRKR